ncbi:Cysteine-rich secretory protein family protein [compost metagenome]
MVGSWIDERRYFRPGIFPNVSSTGNWLDVGHYSLMLWPTVTAVGCAVHRSPRWDYLICRYSPRGNIDGRRVG